MIVDQEWLSLSSKPQKRKISTAIFLEELFTPDVPANLIAQVNPIVHIEGEPPRRKPFNEFNEQEVLDRALPPNKEYDPSAFVNRLQETTTECIQPRVFEEAINVVHAKLTFSIPSKITVFVGDTGFGKTRFCQNFADFLTGRMGGTLIRTGEMKAGLRKGSFGYLKRKLPLGFPDPREIIAIYINFSHLNGYERASAMLVSRIAYAGSGFDNYAEFLFVNQLVPLLPFTSLLRHIRRLTKREKIVLFIDEVRASSPETLNHLIDLIYHYQIDDQNLVCIVTSSFGSIFPSNRFSIFQLPLLDKTAVPAFIKTGVLESMLKYYNDEASRMRYSTQSGVPHLISYFWNFTCGIPRALRVLGRVAASWEKYPVAFSAFIANCANSYVRMVEKSENKIVISALASLLAFHGCNITNETVFQHAAFGESPKNLKEVLFHSGLILLNFRDFEKPDPAPIFTVPFAPPILLLAVSLKNSQPIIKDIIKETGNQKKCNQNDAPVESLEWTFMPPEEVSGVPLIEAYTNLSELTEPTSAEIGKPTAGSMTSYPQQDFQAGGTVITEASELRAITVKFENDALCDAFTHLITIDGKLNPKQFEFANFYCEKLLREVRKELAKYWSGPVSFPPYDNMTFRELYGNGDLNVTWVNPSLFADKKFDFTASLKEIVYEPTALELAATPEGKRDQLQHKSVPKPSDCCANPSQYQNNFYMMYDECPGFEMATIMRSNDHSTTDWYIVAEQMKLTTIEAGQEGAEISKSWESTVKFLKDYEWPESRIILLFKTNRLRKNFHARTTVDAKNVLVLSREKLQDYYGPTLTNLLYLNSMIQQE